MISENSRRFPIKSDEDIDKCTNDLSIVYDAMIDEKSKYIFEKRIMYSLTQDYKYMSDILHMIPQRMVNIDDEIYIYGAGIVGTRLPLLYPEINWVGYVDERKKGTLNGLPILNIEELLHKMSSNTGVFISNMYGYQEIEDELIKRGVVKDKIKCMEKYNKKLSEGIYFDTDLFDLVRLDEGTFVDVGSYDGNDSYRYLKDFNRTNKKFVVAIEADVKNFSKCESMLGDYSNVRLINKGVSYKKGIIKFLSGEEVSSRISENGDLEIEVETLDNLLGNDKVAYIKMDIEGSEKNAIIGAENVIRSQKPVLAISIYHKKEDIWELPSLLLKYNPSYRFWLRHYTWSIDDTVLYAVDCEKLKN